MTIRYSGIDNGIYSVSISEIYPGINCRKLLYIHVENRLFCTVTMVTNENEFNKSVINQ